MNDQLIQEVEESLKKERAEALWKEYGPWIIGGLVMAVVLTGAIVGWRDWNQQVNIEQTTQVLQALDQDDMNAALNEIAGDLRPGPAALARLNAAGLLLREGNREGALSHYQAVIAGRGTPAPFQDLATLMAVRTGWALEQDELAAEDNSGAAQPDYWLRQLQPVWSNARSPWRYHARLQAALILAHDQQDYAQAQNHLEHIINAESSPPSLQERARALAHIYGLRAATAAAADEAEDISEDIEG